MSEGVDHDWIFTSETNSKENEDETKTERPERLSLMFDGQICTFSSYFEAVPEYKSWSRSSHSTGSVMYKSLIAAELSESVFWLISSEMLCDGLKVWRWVTGGADVSEDQPPFDEVCCDQQRKSTTGLLFRVSKNWMKCDETSKVRRNFLYNNTAPSLPASSIYLYMRLKLLKVHSPLSLSNLTHIWISSVVSLFSNQKRPEERLRALETPEQVFKTDQVCLVTFDFTVPLNVLLLLSFLPFSTILTHSLWINEADRSPDHLWDLSSKFLICKESRLMLACDLLAFLSVVFLSKISAGYLRNWTAPAVRRPSVLRSNMKLNSKWCWKLFFYFCN